jgi:hypothetical protein
VTLATPAAVATDLRWQSDHGGDEIDVLAIGADGRPSSASSTATYQRCSCAR